MSKIRIFWCDDQYDTKIEDKPRFLKYLEKKNVEVTPFYNSNELLEDLKKPYSLNNVDAVIFDYNMSNVDDVPDIYAKEKSGFLEILRVIKEYTKKGIPFYLYSKMDPYVIEDGLSGPDFRKEREIYHTYICDSNHPRFFPEGESFYKTVDAVVDEVNSLKTPTMQLRLKYPEAYEAANEISDSCWDHIVRVLSLNPDSEYWNSMEEFLNTLRCDVEDMMTMLKLPETVYNREERIYLNSLGYLISGGHLGYAIPSNMKDVELGYMVTFLVNLLQEGSHSGPTLKYHVREYLKQKKDVNTLFFIAHLLIRLLIWANKARKFMEESGEQLCVKVSTPENKKDQDVPKENGAVVPNSESTPNIIGKLEVDYNGFLHIGDCVIGNWKVGGVYEITAAKKNISNLTNSEYKRYAFPVNVKYNH
ncbi:MAG: hypothetical protein HDS42_00195 [Bacteroides sp.]|nr:hypothetical protein [Bacteroides sp.]